jgi:hypothetical protein
MGKFILQTLMDNFSHLTQVKFRVLSSSPFSHFVFLSIPRMH